MPQSQALPRRCVIWKNNSKIIPFAGKVWPCRSLGHLFLRRQNCGSRSALARSSVQLLAAASGILFRLKRRARRPGGGKIRASSPRHGPSRRHENSFIIKDATGQILGCSYFADGALRSGSTKRLTKDEARDVATNIANLPDILSKYLELSNRLS